MTHNIDLFDVIVDLNSYDKLIVNAAYSTLLDAGEDIVPELIDEFERIDGSARFHVVRAFGEIGDSRAVPLLLEVMETRNPETYFMLPSLAAKALGQINDDTALEGLVSRMGRHHAYGVRRMAVRVLGRFKEHPGAVDALNQALDDADEQVRAIAVESLHRIATPHAYAVLDAAGYLQ